MSNLVPIDPPDLQPLRQSHEADQLESELKQVFLTVFENMVRERERTLNLYGMQHLGGVDLLEKGLTSDGLAVIRRDASRIRFLLKTWRARNPKRGLTFLKRYLQTIWPNEWMVDQFWHPIAQAAQYPAHKTVTGDPVTHFLTSRVRVSVSAAADDGTGLVSIQKALRSTLAARLVLELSLFVELANQGQDGGLALSNGGAGVAPIYSKGALKPYDEVSQLRVSSGAHLMMPVYIVGSLDN